MNNKLIWIGPRESDTFYSNIKFNKIITYNGNANDDIIAFSSQIQTRINQYNTNEWNLPDFLKKNILPLFSDPEVQLMFYNPLQSYLLGNEFVEHAVCVNSRNVMELVRHKAKMRLFARKYNTVVPFVEVQGNLAPSVTFDVSNDKVILQRVISSGGYGTKLMSKEKCIEYINNQNVIDQFIMSPYISDAIPINVHIMIFDDQCIVFPPSLQILQESDDHFIYIGADYNTSFTEHAYLQIIDSAQKLADGLRVEGYRGVCGIDYLLKDEIPYFLETNGRFQASTFLLNNLLTTEGYPSIHEMNLKAFSHDSIQVQSFSHFSFPKSFFTVMGDCIPKWYTDNNDQLPVIIEEIIRDGFNTSVSVTKDAYLFRAIVNRNIGWVTRDETLQIAPNIRPDTVEWKNKILSQEPLALKIGLINQGVSMDFVTKQELIQRGFIRNGVFQSIDVYLPNGLVVNAPFESDFSTLSPYTITLNEKRYFLYYYDNLISEIFIDKEDTYKEKIATHGTKYRQVAFLATDRLRVQHEFRCKFKELGTGCQFCGIKLKTGKYEFEDVYEIVDYYLNNINFRHFLIGGGSGEEKNETKNILNLAKYIRSKTDKSIYVMCLPPDNIDILKDYKSIGINEIGFNLELFDRKIAKEIMPGKGDIPLERYQNAFEEAVRLWGNHGNVRSLMVLGLEREESFFNGIEWLCKIGVMPIISVFRPMNSIVLKQVLPLSNTTLEQIYRKSLMITTKYNLIPGPDCVACQNNTLSMPREIAISNYMD